jgi:hypothetical protein
MKRILLFAVSVLLAASVFSQSGNGNDVLDNALYARVGYGMPGGDLKSNEAITAGALFEVGTIFYINKLKIADKLKLGIDVNYLSFSGFANRETMKNDNKSDSYFNAGAKIGPCLSYNIVDYLVADVYFKVHPHMFIVGETENHNYDGENQFKFGTSFGFNVRYKFIMLGCEFTSAKYDFDLQVPARSIQETSTKSIKLPVTFLSLGVKI